MDQPVPLPGWARTNPQGRALACRPLPVTLGFLYQQPGCCAEIWEHKRPHSGKGWGQECRQPSSTLTMTIRAFRAEAEYQQKPGTKEHSWLWCHREEPDNSQGAVPWGTLGQQSLGFKPPHSLLPLSGPQLSPCEPTLEAYLRDNFQI
jgi:hypothetical protein